MITVGFRENVSKNFFHKSATHFRFFCQLKMKAGEKRETRSCLKTNKREKDIMPKEWGNNKPNISKFTKAVPKDHKELFEKLKKLAENWDYVDKCGVIKQMKAVVVDLGFAANLAKNPDFYIPLKPLKVDEADTLIKALVFKVEKPAPIVEQDAISLFATVETAQ